MQPSNLTLDPAASLWTTNSPNNNLFTQTSSPEVAGDASFGMGGMNLNGDGATETDDDRTSGRGDE